MGAYLEGDGAMEYLSVDPIEAPSVLYSTRKSSALTPEKGKDGVRLRDSFARLLWLSSGTAPQTLSGAAAPTLAGSFAQQREKFSRSYAPPLSHDFALARANAPGEPLVRAEIEGGKQDFVYELNGWNDRAETLGILRTSGSNEPEFRKSLFPVTLSHQSIARDRRDPLTPRFMLTDVDLQLTASDGNDAKLSVLETIVPLGVRQSVFAFDLRSVVYARVGASVGTRTPRLVSVTDEAGRPLVFHHKNHELLVALPEAAEPEHPVKLRFQIEGDFLVRPGGDSYWELGVSSWFPNRIWAASTTRSTR